jgi:hypothetical protein
MCDLSPIELARAKVKRLVRLNKVTGDLSLQSLIDLTKSAIASVTKGDWAVYSTHVQMLEQQYWEEDGQLPDVIDNIILSLGATDSNSSESSIDSSSSDNDSDSDLTDTSKLSQPFAE